MKLTPEQIFALQWIDAQPHTCSRWMRNGKDAYGDAEKWDTFELSGKAGSIRIALADQVVIRHLIEPAGDPDRSRMYRLSEKGRAALETGESSESAALPGQAQLFA